MANIVRDAMLAAVEVCLSRDVEHTSRDIAETLGCYQATVSSALSELVEQGRAVRVGIAPGSRYRLPRPLNAAREPIPAGDLDAAADPAARAILFAPPPAPPLVPTLRILPPEPERGVVARAPGPRGWTGYSLVDQVRRVCAMRGGG